MSEQNLNTLPEQPEAESPVKKGKPIFYVLVAIVALIGIANVSSLLTGKNKTATASNLPMRPSTANAQQVSSFETQQQSQAHHDAENKQRQLELAQAMQQLQAAEDTPGPEADGTQAMTKQQRDAIYGSSPDAPKQTSNVSQASAEAKQKELVREKQHQDAINSDTVAVDFGRVSTAQAREDVTTMNGADSKAELSKTGISEAKVSEETEKVDPTKSYDFDHYQGQLYRIFEGTVLEGVVTNRIDGGLSGPILIMLTTDYYSHDHQQLLMPQGTRLIGSVQSVGNAQQRKMFVTFHRAVCPDGFSLDFDKFVGLDPLGTTGVATKVDHGYLQAFAAAAAVGGLGGLAQVGNSGSVLSAGTEVRNGLSEQTANEGEQILNHFLNRLPVITLKEGARARVYIGRDILIPSYANHRIDPTL